MQHGAAFGAVGVSLVQQGEGKPRLTHVRSDPMIYLHYTAHWQEKHRGVPLFFWFSCSN